MNSPQVKILRGAYQRINQVQLSVYAENVVKRTLDNPTYADVKSLVVTLASDLQAFNNALTAALRGGVSDTVQKDLAKAKLYGSLNVLCDALERLPQADLGFISNAGLSPWNARQSDNSELTPPRLIQVSGTGRRGQIRIAIGDAKAPGTLNYAVEYSSDNGATWTNGTYSSRRSFVVSDLPPGRDLQVRIRALATRARRSNWSEPVTAAVA